MLSFQLNHEGNTTSHGELYPRLQHLYFGDIRGIERKYTFNTYSVGEFSYSESFSSAFASHLDHITTEGLNTFLISFNNFIAYNDIVALGENSETLSFR